jgi:hypothetical protein
MADAQTVPRGGDAGAEYITVASSQTSQRKLLKKEVIGGGAKHHGSVCMGAQPAQEQCQSHYKHQLWRQAGLRPLCSRAVGERAAPGARRPVLRALWRRPGAARPARTSAARPPTKALPSFCSSPPSRRQRAKMAALAGELSAELDQAAAIVDQQLGSSEAGQRAWAKQKRKELRELTATVSELAPCGCEWLHGVASTWPCSRRGNTCSQQGSVAAPMACGRPPPSA